MIAAAAVAAIGFCIAMLLSAPPRDMPSEISQSPMVVTCNDRRAVASNDPSVFRLYPSSNVAEMIVHVPKESVDRGVAPGNRKGTLHSTERAYEIDIPADAGGSGDQSWLRMRFALSLDRFTGQGTLEIGESRYGEVAKIPVQCSAAQQKPLF